MKMRNSSKKITKYISLFILMSVLLLTGCGKQSASDTTVQTGTDSASEAVVYVPDTGYAEYSCETEIDAEEIIYVQLDINPSFILGMTKDFKVVSIVANNEDAEDVMLNCLGDYFAGAVGGVELETVICDLAEATKQGGYIEDSFDVSVTVISGEVEESIFNEAFEQAASNLAEDSGIEAAIESFTAEPEISTESQSGSSSGNQDSYDEPENDSNPEAYDDQGSNDNPDNPDDEMAREEDKTCDLCHGECTVVCDLCNGEGTITEIEEHEIEVRNSYVCPYCGGAGILDDGLHGGQTAVCGHCGGEGKTGPMSGDFRELAFDIEIVEEEHENPCPRCNGAGTMDCPHCNGTGVIE